MPKKLIFNPLSGNFDYINIGEFSVQNFVSKEIPTGLHDGINNIFTLAFTPVLGTEHIFLNGQLQEEGENYTISGSQITFDVAPEIISNVRISYFK